jgi:hypothetical protein
MLHKDIVCAVDIAMTDGLDHLDLAGNAERSCQFRKIMLWYIHCHTPPSSFLIAKSTQIRPNFLQYRNQRAI